MSERVPSDRPSLRPGGVSQPDSAWRVRHARQDMVEADMRATVRAAHHALTHPSILTPDATLLLQRVVGNAAVGAILAPTRRGAQGDGSRARGCAAGLLSRSLADPATMASGEPSAFASLTALRASPAYQALSLEQQQIAEALQQHNDLHLFEEIAEIDTDHVQPKLVANNLSKDWYAGLSDGRKRGAVTLVVAAALGGGQPVAGGRPTVLGGGLPREPVSLGHLMSAYLKAHNLAVYDPSTQPVLTAYTRQLAQQGMGDIAFQTGQGASLATVGRVPNHDFIIAFPGPFWIEGNPGLADDLHTVLGPGSVAYIMTDHGEAQTVPFEQSLRKHADLQIAGPNLVTVAATGRNILGHPKQQIDLGGVGIEPTQPGPYYTWTITTARQ